MFDPKSVDAFQSIKAPNHLQERVLKARPKRRTLYPVFGTAVAAGLAAVFLAVQFFSATPTGVTVGGLAVENQAVLLPNQSVPMMARMGAMTTQSVCFDEAVTVTSLDGTLTDEMYNALSLPYEAKADTPVLWHVQTPPDTFTLTAEAEGEELQLRLTYDETQNNWTICRVTAE